MIQERSMLKDWSKWLKVFEWHFVARVMSRGMQTIAVDRRKAIAVTVVVIAVTGCGNEGARTSANRGFQIDANQSVDVFVHGQNRDEIMQATATSFREASADRLSQLTKHDDRGTALRAAWEQATRRRVKTGDSWHIEATGVERFLGFAEGRLHVCLPDWWQRRILSVRIDDAGRTDFLRGEDAIYQKSDLGRFYCGRDLTVKRYRARVRLASGVASESIPYDRFLKLVESATVIGPSDGLAASFSTDRWFLAIHSIVCGPYRLVCLQRKTGRVLWTQDVWAGGCPYPMLSGMDSYDYLGWQFHWVGIVHKAQELFVFGIGAGAAYVEGFETSDGRTLFRFSTSF
jgi:hypothetical protein